MKLGAYRDQANAPKNEEKSRECSPLISVVLTKSVQNLVCARDLASNSPTVPE